MATLADSLVSSSSRKLPIRKRPDLKARRQRYQGRNYWVVKDPVGLQYYRFEEEEYAILQMLDGDSSLDEIAERFERDFPPQTIRTEELQQFIGMLHRSGLVITDAPGQGQQLVKRRAEKTKQERLATLANILSLRFKGVDPEGFFNFIYPYIRWFFSVTAMCVCITIGLAALTLIFVQFDVFHSRLPDFHSFFKAKNWLWLGLTLCVTKILHEFGHGLSCKHFGGECHEIGVMFLVLTPCLYCNVSDSWMLPNRWHRAAIGAAGMYVELVLASICTFIWWFTSPASPVSYICLNVMFISSVSTLMFNANPLLRYDGYYILSDILEIPNLRQKASTILNRKLGAWCLGLEEPEDPFLPQRKQWLFATYTVASAIYRWVVTFSILYFLNRVFQPYGLKVLGQAIALGSIYGLVGQPLWNLYKFFKVPGRLGDVKRARLYATMLLIIGAIVGIGMIPLPSHVYCPLEVQARQADSDWVYADVDGILEEVLVHPGQQVKKGELLARLRNIDKEISLAELVGQRNLYATQLEGLKTASFDDHHAASQIDPTRKSLRGTELQLVQNRLDLEKLNLVAPREGTVLPPPIVEKHSDEIRLPTWSGSPFDPENIGAHLVHGARFCQIGDPKKMEARLVIDQNEVEFVAPGQKVEIMLDQTADYVYANCEIEQISTEDLKASPAHLSSLHGGPLASKTDATGVARPLNPIFEAIVPLPEQDPHNLLRLGLTGKAKITTAPRTLFSRIYRYAAHTFNFEL